MKIWGLYSSLVDYGCSSELIELFADEAQARFVRDMLIGKLCNARYPSKSVWRDYDDYDPEDSDLHVREIIVR